MDPTVRIRITQRVGVHGLAFLPGDTTSVDPLDAAFLLAIGRAELVHESDSATLAAPAARHLAKLAQQARIDARSRV